LRIFQTIPSLLVLTLFGRKHFFRVFLLYRELRDLKKSKVRELRDLKKSKVRDHG
jgi:hypothetical protein